MLVRKSCAIAFIDTIVASEREFEDVEIETAVQELEIKYEGLVDFGGEHLLLLLLHMSRLE